VEALKNFEGTMIFVSAHPWRRCFRWQYFHGGCPILSRLVRKGGQHGPQLISQRTQTVWVRGTHPCKERRDGAPSVV
jgi:hypothetical protein